MKPELVSDKRLEKLELVWRRKDHPYQRPRDKRTQTKAFLAGARATLEELGAIRVIVLELDQRKRPTCSGCMFGFSDEQGMMCALEDEGHACIRKGPVLVRVMKAKDRTP